MLGLLKLLFTFIANLLTPGEFFTYQRDYEVQDESDD